MIAAEVELRGATGHPEPVLAKKLLDAIEAHVRDKGGSYASIAREAEMTPQQLGNIKTAVERDPDHVLKSDVMERLAKAIGYQWKLEPAAPEKGSGS